MNLLTMEHITKAYTDRVLLNDVAFSINENEKIGVIGINGMGKSTLLKVAAGIEPYDEGKISIGNQVKICPAVRRRELHWSMHCLHRQISWYWMNRPTTWIMRCLSGWRNI